MTSEESMPRRARSTGEHEGADETAGVRGQNAERPRDGPAETKPQELLEGPVSRLRGPRDVAVSGGADCARKVAAEKPPADATVGREYLAGQKRLRGRRERPLLSPCGHLG